MEDLASLVKAVMTERGMSRRDVEAAADRHGYKVSHSTVSKIATGKYASPGERILVGLSKALDVPIERLRKAAGVSDPGTPFRLPDYASRLSSSERAAVEHLVRVMVEAKDNRMGEGDEHDDGSASIRRAAGSAAEEDDELARRRRPGWDFAHDSQLEDQRAALQDGEVGIDETPDDSV